MTPKVLYRQSIETPGVGSPGFETILKDPGESFLWRMDDYPFALGRWNYHPEIEIHLVRRSEGHVFVGDHIGQFMPGHLCVIGPNLPHNWVTDIKPGEVIKDRDIVIQFDPGILRRGSETFPEMAEIDDFLAAAARGLHYHGATACAAADLMETMGTVRGLSRLVLFFDLIRLLAGSIERTHLSSEHFSAGLKANGSDVIQSVLEYILKNFQYPLSMSEAADRVGMTRPTFCRYFRKSTGRNFRDYVRILRIAESCRLLSETDARVTDICFRVGYRNIANFNRHFLLEKGVTPTAYRRLRKART